MAEKIEKKISRVMRWLERCALACQGKSYGSALMDMECARVDFDSARDEIWNAANKQYGPKSGNFYFMKFFRTAVITTVILLSTAAPVSFIENTFAVAATDSLEWVSPDEKALLISLRERLSNANSGWVSDIADSSVEIYSDAPKPDAKEIRRAPSGRAEQNLAGRSDEQPSNVINETQIFTLIRIGENALRGKSSAVMIER